jgi:hypothetical protein
LDGNIITQKGQRSARLEWETISERDSLTKGYYLYVDFFKEGELLRINKTGLVKRKTVDYLIDFYGGRAYTFKIVPVSIYGIVGKGKSIQIFIGTSTMPKIRTVNTILQPDNSILIKWEYPELTEVKGFQIFINGKKQIGHDKIKKKKREWLIENLPKANDNRIEVQVRAVGDKRFSEMSRSRIIKLNSKVNVEIAAPKKLKSEVKETDKGFIVILKWKEVDLEKQGIKGYYIYGDLEEEGVVKRLAENSFVTSNTVEFFVSKKVFKKRKQLEFKIIPIDKNRKTGLSTTIVVETKVKKDKK